MRGAPQVGFSLATRRIKARRLAWVVGGLCRLRPDNHVQHRRKPARCQRIMVWLQEDDDIDPTCPEASKADPETAIGSADSRASADRANAASCWRTARFSSARSARGWTPDWRLRSITRSSRNMTARDSVLETERSRAPE